MPEQSGDSFDFCVLFRVYFTGKGALPVRKPDYISIYDSGIRFIAFYALCHLSSPPKPRLYGHLSDRYAQWSFRPLSGSCPSELRFFQICLEAARLHAAEPVHALPYVSFRPSFVLLPRSQQTARAEQVHHPRGSDSHKSDGRRRY